MSKILKEKIKWVPPCVVLTIDNRMFQFSCRAVAAILFPITLILGVYGCIFLYATVVSFTYIALIFGLSSLLGAVGYISAWYRVTKKYNDMSSRQVQYVRFGLFSGVLSCLLLLGLSMYTQVWSASFLLIFIIVGGAVFVKSTPKHK